MKLTRWSDLPKGIEDHLLNRLRIREITVDDLNKLRFWLDSEPEVPEADWFRNFGTFKLAGTGSEPRTFLRAEQPAWGTEILPEPLDEQER